MPQLETGTLDLRKLDVNVHAKYDQFIKERQRGYYWLIFFIGAIGFFLCFFL